MSCSGASRGLSIKGKIIQLHISYDNETLGEGFHPPLPCTKVGVHEFACTSEG